MKPYTVYSDSVLIHTSARQVWNVLTDFKNYPNWNPFTYQVETELKPGKAVKMHVNLPRRGKKLQIEYVREIRPPHLLSWGMTMGAEILLVALRTQTITPIDESTCRYQTQDTFTGYLTPLVRLIMASSIRDGFNQMAYALKTHAEALAAHHDLSYS